MPKPQSIALYAGGVLIVLTTVPLIAMTSFRFVHMVLFKGTQTDA